MAILDVVGWRASGFKRRLTLPVFFTWLFGRDSRQKSRPINFFFVFAFTLLIAIGSITHHPIVQMIESTLLDISSPLIAGAQSPFSHISSLLNTLQTQSKLLSEIDTLKSENQQLSQTLMTYKQQRFVQKENIKKLPALNILLKKDFALETALTANVINQPMQGHHLLISLQNIDEIDVNWIVLGQQGIVGRVTACGRNVAKITPIESINSRIPVEINGVQAIANGKGDHILLTHLKDALHTINVGDEVVTSGYGGIFPKGLPLGVVKKIDNKVILIEPYESTTKHHTVLLIPPVEIDYHS